MHGHQSEKGRTNRRWRVLSAALAIGGVMISGCGDDSEQMSPMAPSAIGGNDESSGGTHAAGMGSSGTLTGNSNGGAGSAGGSEQSKGSSNALEYHDDRPEPVAFTELPPGYSAAQLQAMVDERNAQLEGMAARNLWGPRPGRIRNVRVVWDPDFFGGALSFEFTRPSNGGDNYRIEWERLNGLPCERPHVSSAAASDNCRSDQFNDGVGVGLTLLRRHLTSHYYKFWLQNRNDNGAGPWTMILYKVELDAPPPAPVPIPTGISASGGNWECDTSEDNGCTREMTIKGVGSANDATIELQQLENGSWSTKSTGDDGYTVDLKPGSYYFRAREIDGTRKERVDRSRKRVRLRPSRNAISVYGAVPGAVANLDVRRVGDDRWQISWDTPETPGGWRVTHYRIGDVGPSVNQHSPGRTCKGNGWPAFRYGVDTQTHQSGPDGQKYSAEYLLHLPSGWKLAITAVNAKGEGACADSR